MWGVLDILLTLVAGLGAVVYFVAAGVLKHRAAGAPDFAAGLITWLLIINFILIVLLISFAFDLPLSSTDNF